MSDDVLFEKKEKVICQICGRDFKSYRALGIHINKIHGFSKKDYYDKYLKNDPKEHLCSHCGINIIHFINLVKGYSSGVCVDCGKIKIKQTKLERYGVPLAYLLSNTYSLISQELFDILFYFLDEEDGYNCFFGRNEYWLKYDNNKYYFYDFCIKTKDTKKIIEFNGDYWHRNPKIYEATEENLEIWNKDKYKKQIAEENGFDVFYVWESDYKENPEKTVEACVDFIYY